jgi:glutathione S-transferase
MNDLESLRRYFGLTADPSKVNVELLRGTLEHITAHPETWKQDSWAVRDTHRRADCGAAFCLAGHVAVAIGEKIDWEKEASEYADGTISVTYVESGWTIEDVATRALGLAGDDAEELFGASNSLADLWIMAHALTNGAIEVPDEFAESYGRVARCAESRAEDPW